VPLYRAAPAAVQSRAAAADQPAAVACRCCPGGISRTRRRPCYPSDMSGAEWAVCEPLLPHPAWLAGKGGRPSGYCMRDIVDGIRYLTHNGPVWRALPADFPPAWTVYYWAAKWQADGSTETMHGRLREQVRQVAGRKTAPTAAIIDSQSVKAAEEVARASRGYDAGKKVNGRKRHIAVDVTGLLLTVLVTAASVQDRDAAKPLLWNLKKAFPTVRLAWADGIYAGKLVTWAASALKLTVQIVRRPGDLHTFQVLPRRSPRRFAAAVEMAAEEAARAGRPDWPGRHAMQVWCGLADSKQAARACLAPAMEAFYQLPFERFERYCPCGTAGDVAEFLAAYAAAGCTEFNLIPQSPDPGQAIAGTAAVKRLLSPA